MEMNAIFSPDDTHVSTYLGRSGRPPKRRMLFLVLLSLIGAGTLAALLSFTQNASAGMLSSRVTSTDPSAGDSLNCGPNWTVVTSPDPSPQQNFIEGVAAVSATDMWAVGYFYNSFWPDNQVLTEHWDGTSWSVVISPNPNTHDNYLEGVTAVSSNDVWAVGFYVDNANHAQTLTEHWDGSGYWRIIGSPDPSTTQNFLTGIAAVSSTDMWAVGNYYNGTAFKSLIEHWNGGAWTVAATPILQGWDPLAGVAAVSTNNVWAVGHLSDPSDPNRAMLTLIEHWDGFSWTVVPSPNGYANSGNLKGITAISSNDIWAVGYADDTPPGIYQTLIEHWNGSNWTVVASPNPGSNNNELLGVAALSNGDAWAVGDYDNSTSLNTVQTLIARWNGSTWTRVTGTDIATYDNYLNGVAAVSSNDVWTVGSYSNHDEAHTLIERYSPCPPSPTATVTATATTVAGTSTPTPAIDTPTAIATPTPMQFRDVPRNSPFYTYIECLVGRGIISGYPDDTFKPNNPITRGQLSKVVSNSAGYSEQHTARTFQDVPANSTFYQFIERLASRGYVAGYACGGVGEPCGPGNLQYFRPNANVTRGQTSKIVASAKGLPAPPSGQRTFQDVQANSTFWQWIEALAGTGAIQGYPCGGDGEPCMPPGNLPYFRPSNDVTRGQSTKIVGNTFFPDCQTQDR